MKKYMDEPTLSEQIAGRIANTFYSGLWGQVGGVRFSFTLYVNGKEYDTYPSRVAMHQAVIDLIDDYVTPFDLEADTVPDTSYTSLMVNAIMKRATPVLEAPMLTIAAELTGPIVDQMYERFKKELGKEGISAG